MFKAKPQKTKKDDIEEKRLFAAVKIQSVVRKFIAGRRVRTRAKRIWQRVYDPKFRIYFWYNRLNGGSQWHVPKFLTLFTDEDHASATKLNSIVREYLAKMRVRKILYARYSRFYDSNVNKFYWLDKKTQKTTWKVSKWIIKQEVPLPPEDVMLYKSNQKIKELEEKLKVKEQEIKQVRKQRYEELEPLVIADRVKNAKALKRSKDMDVWTMDDLAAWLTEMKMDQYIDFIFKNRVDGYLFVNLEDDDWEDMGITNKFHIRKLQLIMKAYRTRFARKKDKIEVDEDDDLVSEYSPSELSDIIGQEDLSEEEEDSLEDSQDGYVSDEDAVVVLTEEQKQDLALNRKNMQIEMLVPGDGENFPMVGDIVRIRYTCSLVQNEKIVMSTKNGMQLPDVEFVLGVNQVIKGFDRAVPQMSIGERSKVFLTAEYAYGKEGLYPHIPPDAEIVFDLTLLGFRPRPAWAKPLIQELGHSMKPYEQTVSETDQGKQVPDEDDGSSVATGKTKATSASSKVKKSVAASSKS